MFMRGIGYWTLCDPMDCNTSGSSVFHYLLEFAQIYRLERLPDLDQLGQGTGGSTRVRRQQKMSTVEQPFRHWPGPAQSSSSSPHT